jgi:hypothetical protein
VRIRGFGSKACWPEEGPDLREAGTALSERVSMKSFTMKSLLYCYVSSSSGQSSVRQRRTSKVSRVKTGARPAGVRDVVCDKMDAVSAPGRDIVPGVYLRSIGGGLIALCMSSGLRVKEAERQLVSVRFERVCAA